MIVLELQTIIRLSYYIFSSQTIKNTLHLERVKQKPIVA